jgi:hypothetical protein
MKICYMRVWMHGPACLAGQPLDSSRRRRKQAGGDYRPGQPASSGRDPWAWPRRLLLSSCSPRHAHRAQSECTSPPVIPSPRPAGHHDDRGYDTVRSFSTSSGKGCPGSESGLGSRHAHFATPGQGLGSGVMRVSAPEASARGSGHGGRRFLRHLPDFSTCFAGHSAAILFRASSQAEEENVLAVAILQLYCVWRLRKLRERMLWRWAWPRKPPHTIRCPRSGGSVTLVSALEAAAHGSSPAGCSIPSQPHWLTLRRLGQPQLPSCIGPGCSGPSVAKVKIKLGSAWR